jgi:hypothetical protein
MVLTAFEPDRGQCGTRAVALLGQAELAVVQRQLDVLQRRGARQQVEVLEHEADLPIADGGAGVGRQLGDGCARQPIGALRRPIEAAEDVHERRLARPGGAHDGDELAARDVERHAAQGLHLDVAEPVDLPQVAHFNQ